MDVAVRPVLVVSMCTYLSGSIYGGREDDDLSSPACIPTLTSAIKCISCAFTHQPRQYISLHNCSPLVFFTSPVTV